MVLFLVVLPKCTFKSGEELGFQEGITAVIEQCATETSTFQNGDTGAVMFCDGGHSPDLKQMPSRPLVEPPSPIAGEPEHHRIPERLEEPQIPQEI